MIGDPFKKVSKTIHYLRAAFIIFALATIPVFAQTSPTATLRGTVTLGDSDKPIHNVLITILQLKRTVGTNEQGQYEFNNVPPGRYDILAHLDRVPDIVQRIDIAPGAPASLDFKVQLSGLQEQVTVTATGSAQSLSSSIQSVEVIGSVDLAKKSPVSLAKRLTVSSEYRNAASVPVQQGP